MANLGNVLFLCKHNNRRRPGTCILSTIDSRDEEQEATRTRELDRKHQLAHWSFDLITVGDVLCVIQIAKSRSQTIARDSSLYLTRNYPRQVSFVEDFSLSKQCVMEILLYWMDLEISSQWESTAVDGFLSRHGFVRRFAWKPLQYMTLCRAVCCCALDIREVPTIAFLSTLSIFMLKLG